VLRRISCSSRNFERPFTTLDQRQHGSERAVVAILRSCVEIDESSAVRSQSAQAIGTAGIAKRG